MCTVSSTTNITLSNEGAVHSAAERTVRTRGDECLIADQRTRDLTMRERQWKRAASDIRWISFDFPGVCACVHKIAFDEKIWKDKVRD